MNETSELLVEAAKKYDYDPNTGIFKHRKNYKIAGYLRKGFVRIKIGNKVYSAHRIAWILMTGKNPLRDIDHIDGNRSNNAFSNLREATGSQNQMNKSLTMSNKFGYIGVCWDKRQQKWYSSISKDNVCHYLGRFETAEEAAIARDKVAITMHGEFAKLNFKHEVDKKVKPFER